MNRDRFEKMLREIESINPKLSIELSKHIYEVMNKHIGNIKNYAMEDGDFMISFNCDFDGKPGYCAIYSQNKMSEMIMEKYYDYCKRITKLI